MVIVASGLDARAYRLSWPAETTIYEIDQPEVIDFKATTLSGLGAAAGAEHHPVGIDLRDVPLGLYDVTVSFVTYEPDQEIAWTILFNGNPVGHVYGYRLEPINSRHV